MCEFWDLFPVKSVDNWRVIGVPVSITCFNNFKCVSLVSFAFTELRIF